METVEIAGSTHNGSRFDKILTKIASDFGFEYASFAVFGQVSSHAFGFSTYPDEWQQHYLQNGYQQIDPAATIATRAIAPVDWSRLKGIEAMARFFFGSSRFRYSASGNYDSDSRLFG